MADRATILVYVREWNFDQMLHLAQEIWGPRSRMLATSDFNGCDDTNLIQSFHREYRSVSSKTSSIVLSQAEIADVTMRCRLLRSIPPQRARRMLLAMERAIDGILNEVRPHVMLSLTVDTYVLDLYARLCEKRGVRFIGLVPSFLKGHFRITARGEHVDSREPTRADIDLALRDLNIKDYRPDFLVQSSAEMRRQARRLWLRNLPKPMWFALLRMAPRERMNCHYWISQLIASRYWSLLPPRGIAVRGVSLEKLKELGEQSLIYLPLQMSPEATIDYWSADARWIDYENFVIDILQRHRDKWHFVVKEHPNVLGRRSRGFYQRLEAEPNCTIAAPQTPSNDFVDLCRAVLVCTGTAGFEAALRGKPVVTDSAPYYAPPSALFPISALDGDLPVSGIDTNRQTELIAYLLRSTLPGRFLNNGTWNIDNPDHRHWGETMARSIRGFLDRNMLSHPEMTKLRQL